MAKQVVNVGSAPNSLDGDALRNAFIKLNNNVDELYTYNAAIPVTVVELASEMLVNGTHQGITVTYDPINLVVNLTGFSGNYNDLTNKPFTSVESGSAATVYTPGDLAFDGSSSAAVYDPTLYNLDGGGA